MTAATIVKAYDLMGYDAVCVGSRDLIGGLKYLQDLKKTSKFLWLSANVVRKSTQKKIFKASASIKLGKIKAGVIGLTGPAILSASDDATILPWDQVLPDLVATMAKSNDLLILLSNLPAADNQRIAEDYPTLHLIIQSGASANTISPAPINNTIMVSTAPQGKQIGIMEINWQPSKLWRDPQEEVLAQKKLSLERLLWQLSKFQQDKDPETALRNQPEQLEAYHILLSQEKQLRGEIDQASKLLIPRPPAKRESSVHTNRFIAMETSLPDHLEISRLISDLDAKVNELGKSQAASLATKADSPYLGFRGCGVCHAPQMASWQSTKHATAYKTLIKDKQHFNQNCLPCHVTGIAIPQAAEALTLPDDRRGVGCEACHGPGRRHSQSPKANPMNRKPGSQVCLGCHTQDHDTTFSYEKKIKMVEHQ